MDTLRRKTTLALCLVVSAILSFPLRAAADGPKAKSSSPSQVTFVAHKVSPSESVYKKWLKNFFVTGEIWRFKSREDFETFVDSFQMDSKLKARLKSLYLDRLFFDEMLKAGDQFPVEAAGGFVEVPNDLREQIPPAVVQGAYTYLQRNYGKLPRHFFRRKTLEEVRQFLSAQDLPESTRNRLLADTVYLNGRYYVLITPHIWRFLPNRLRKFVVDSELLPAPVRVGFRGTLLIRRGDDLSAIAKKYAGERDPGPIEQDLRRMLGDAESVTIPLEKVLPPFMRIMIDTYASCNGPNCYNTGPNVNRGKDFRVKHLTAPDLMEEAYSRYRFVKPGEPLQVGDLLIYRNASQRVVHVSSYAGDGMVFTKNGFNRFSPYLLQPREYNARIYFHDGKYRLMVLRIPKAGEKTVDESDAAPVFYWEHPELRAGPAFRRCARRYFVNMN